MQSGSSAKYGPVLVASPTTDLAAAAGEMLRQAGIPTRTLTTLEDLATFPLNGVEAILVPEEALSQPATAALTQAIHRQPAWSALPVIIITGEQEPMPATMGLPANPLFVRRPLRAAELVGTVRFALATRRQQRRLAEYVAAGQRRHLALEASGTGTWDWNIVTGRLSWSDRCLALFGLAPGAAMSYERFLEAVHPEDRQRVDQAVKASLERKGRYRIEMRTIWPDGSLHWILARGRGFYNQAGRPVRMSGTVVDITERKEAEAALRQSEERFRGTFENAAVGITHIDLEGRWLRVNRKLREMLGYSEDELRGVRFTDITHPDDREEDLRHYGRLIRGELDNYTVEKRYIRKDGSVIWQRVTRSAQHDPSGAVPYTISVVEDITARRQVEEALRQSEEKFRTLAENARASFGIVQGTRFVYANPYFAEVSGYTVPELLSMEFTQLVHPDFRAMMLERARLRWMGRPVSNHYEFMMLTKSGEARWVDFSVGTIVYEGKLAMIGSGFDITEYKRAVEALRESQQQLQAVNLHLEQRVTERTAEAERRAEQLRELASELARAEQHERSRVAGILHDNLQQLLVGAKFGTSVLRGRLGEDSQRQALQKVDDLLNESLETSRNLTIELSPPILKGGTLAAALHWLAGWIHDKHGLQVHLKTDETLNPQDEGVRILLFESVRELLFNIVKHAGTDSACMTLERCNGEHLRIIVADAGLGFEPRSQGSRDRPGGALGLFSIHERLSFIGGRFEIDSAPGKGASMTLVAPLRLPSAEPAARIPAGLLPATEQVVAAVLETPTCQPTAAGQLARIRVLVADDHAVVRDGLAQLLRMYADVEVVGLASDGQHAVELAMSLRPDVILMDVSMPRLNGIDATRRVLSELPQVCVIGLSMHAEDEMARRMHDAGAVDYLIKTAPPDVVFQAIRRCMGSAEMAEPR